MLGTVPVKEMIENILVFYLGTESSDRHVLLANQNLGLGLQRIIFIKQRK